MNADESSPHDPTRRFKFHLQEICGCAINPLNRNIIATGGNDNLLVITDIRLDRPVLNLTAHKAAIRGLAWDTRRANFLYTGGGSNDRKLKMWNINSKTLERSVYTGSQICEVLYFDDIDEVITAHGFSSNNICVWTGNGLEKIAELSGHSKRVVHCVKTHNANQILSGSSDQSLRFWDLVPRFGSRFSKDCECQQPAASLLGHCECYERVRNLGPSEILYNEDVAFGEKGVYKDQFEFDANLHPFYARKKWNRKCRNGIPEKSRSRLISWVPDFSKNVEMRQEGKVAHEEQYESEIELEIQNSVNCDSVVETLDVARSEESRDNENILRLCSEGIRRERALGIHFF